MIATAILSACGVSNAVTSSGEIVGKPNFESIYKDTFSNKKSSQRGIMVDSPADSRLRLVQIGTSKKAAMSETAWGRPHYTEGFGSKLLTWNFAWKDDKQEGGFSHCQAKVTFDSHNIARQIFWNPMGCVLTVEPPTKTTTIIREIIKEPHVQKRVLKAGALFDFDRAELKSQFIPELEELANYLLDMDSLSKIVIVGHTDPAGSAEYNQKLSQDRAKAVALYFAQKGIPENLISVVGMGESQLVKQCGGNVDKPSPETKACNYDNRRVEVFISGVSATKTGVEVNSNKASEATSVSDDSDTETVSEQTEVGDDAN